MILATASSFSQAVAAKQQLMGLDYMVYFLPEERKSAVEIEEWLELSLPVLNGERQAIVTLSDALFNKVRKAVRQQKLRPPVIQFYDDGPTKVIRMGVDSMLSEWPWNMFDSSLVSTVR